MKKIMFNDKYGLTEAVLSGRKTMTRRVIKCNICRMLLSYSRHEGIDVSRDEFTLKEHSPYEVGEVVAVAQSYEEVLRELESKILSEKFQALPLRTQADYKARYRFLNNFDGIARTNKMFVHAIAMPHRIRITDIKVERQQDITDEDCLREGVVEVKGKFIADNDTMTEGRGFLSTALFRTPREAFAALIDKTCGTGTWESNPFVFAYTFELCDPTVKSQTT